MRYMLKSDLKFSAPNRLHMHEEQSAACVMPKKCRLTMPPTRFKTRISISASCHGVCLRQCDFLDETNSHTENYTVHMISAHVSVRVGSELRDGMQDVTPEAFRHLMQLDVTDRDNGSTPTTMSSDHSASLGCEPTEVD
eukprot:gnl/TRDRNA2_/TRDRNA2_72711_c0_seq1.p2 gnl/TRDRNA2_/TRDRNA2_72711_c0~~gnl/TRDRNA2_/TRDRNA2_72711_c0_seq1.p2  ORF type:complete len:139 (-),score=9.40 gnl/TRDRNA2_/TRDRNA2_72711_c0_seq1:57-473(-)